MSDTIRWVEIVSTPRGEAPGWVREAWIGVKLPDAGITPTGKNFGIVSGNKVDSGQPDDFIIDREVAVQLLAVKDPQAANWFREKVGTRGNFVFRRSEVAVTTPPTTPGDHLLAAKLEDIPEWRPPTLPE